MTLPEEMGIMVLPEVVFFPHNLMPLHIFEPRYRLMLNRALDGDRMFALAQPDRKTGRRPCEVSGVGLIRACVQNSDGSSNLILQGLCRARFHEIGTSSNYYVGKPEEIVDEESPDTVENEALATKILEQVHHIQDCREALPQELRDFLSEIKDFHMLVDIVAGSFIKHPERKQELLETPNLSRRLRILAICLCQEYPKDAA
ncbi:MAG: LON peptidase substrate-binding domain-containing protein [Blastochloris sp.]|nr:LON peptidase substrate-binding domain-containing protein [Blastochloris sp.]